MECISTIKIVALFAILISLTECGGQSSNGYRSGDTRCDGSTIMECLSDDKNVFISTSSCSWRFSYNCGGNFCVKPAGTSAFCAPSDHQDPICTGTTDTQIRCNGDNPISCHYGYNLGQEPSCAPDRNCVVGPGCVLSTEKDPACVNAPVKLYSRSGDICADGKRISCTYGYRVQEEKCAAVNLCYASKTRPGYAAGVSSLIKNKHCSQLIPLHDTGCVGNLFVTCFEDYLVSEVDCSLTNQQCGFYGCQ